MKRLFEEGLYTRSMAKGNELMESIKGIIQAGGIDDGEDGDTFEDDRGSLYGGEAGEGTCCVIGSI